MYAKLSFRNARRSFSDYLLYITTLIVLSAIMMFSNLLAAASSQNGLQASSAPLIISMVAVALLSYINGYMLRSRAKEFATYILLGMKKNRIAAVFFGESLLLALVGLFIGLILGSLCFLSALSFLRAWFPIAESFSAVLGIAARDSLLYFITIQVLSLLSCLYKVKKMKIGNLMKEERKNQTLKGKPHPLFWSIFCIVCVAADLVFVSFITGSNDILMMLGTNTVIFSLILGVWAFYKASFHWLAWLRLNRRSELYQGSRLYLVAQMLSKIASNILLNTVLSVCLLFSVMTFSVGLIMPNIPGDLFPGETGIWMSFVQICMSIVFIAIYFSILAVRQVIEAKENRRAFRMMAYLGKTDRQRKSLIKQEIVLKYTLPAIMCLFILTLCAGQINEFLNSFLSAGNLLFAAIGYFTVCLMLMYAGYSFVAYKLCVKNIL